MLGAKVSLLPVSCIHSSVLIRLFPQLRAPILVIRPGTLPPDATTVFRLIACYSRAPNAGCRNSTVSVRAERPPLVAAISGTSGAVWDGAQFSLDASESLEGAASVAGNPNVTVTWDCVTASGGLCVTQAGEPLRFRPGLKQARFTLRTHTCAFSSNRIGLCVIACGLQAGPLLVQRSAPPARPPQNGTLSSGPSGSTDYVFTVTLSAASRADSSAVAAVTSVSARVPTVTVAPSKAGMADPAAVFSLSGGVDPAGPPAEPFSLAWAQVAGPALNLSAATILPNNATARIVFLPGTLRPGAAYTLRLTAAAAASRGAGSGGAAGGRRLSQGDAAIPLGFAEVSFLTAAVPSGSGSLPPPAAPPGGGAGAEGGGGGGAGGNGAPGPLRSSYSQPSRASGWLGVTGPAQAVAFESVAASASGIFSAETGGWLTTGGASYAFTYVVPSAAGQADGPLPEGVLAPFSPIPRTLDLFHLPPGDPSTGYAVTLRVRALALGGSAEPSEPAEVNVTVLPRWRSLAGNSSASCDDWAAERAALLEGVAAATSGAGDLPALGRAHARLALSRAVLDTLQAFAAAAPSDAVCPGLVRGYAGLRNVIAREVAAASVAGVPRGDVQQVTGLLGGLVQPESEAADPAVMVRRRTGRKHLLAFGHLPLASGPTLSPRSVWRLRPRTPVAQERKHQRIVAPACAYRYAGSRSVHAQRHAT